MSEERINDPEEEQVASADPPNNTKELPNALSSPDSEPAPLAADPPNNT